MRRRQDALPPLAAAVLAASLVTLASIATPCTAYDPITWSTIDGGGVTGVMSGAYRQYFETQYRTRLNG